MAKAPRGPFVDKAWREAIRVAVNEEDAEGFKKLRRLATKLVDLAADGDVSALREIGDRLDGKPAQALEHTGADGEPLVITWQPQS